jgi:Transposase zinc-binding domain
VARPALEVADIFRGHGPAWRQANAGHVSLDQLKVMSAIERCRTAALGGHVARCEDCAYTAIAYNSCLMCRSGMGSWRDGAQIFL